MKKQNHQKVDRLYLSKQMMDELKRLSPGKSVFFPGRHVHVSPMLPFERFYDACDIESKMEIKIASGEWIHAIALPEIPDFIDLEPLSLEISPTVIEEDRRNNFLNSFMFKGRRF